MNPQSPGFRDSGDPLLDPRVFSRAALLSVTERRGRLSGSRLWKAYRAHRVAAALIAAAIAWVPIAVLVLRAGSRQAGALAGFAHDYGLHVRAWIAIPLLIVLEPLVDRRIRFAAKRLLQCGFVRRAEWSRYDDILAATERMRDRKIVPLISIAAAVALTLFSATRGLGRPQAAWSFVGSGSIRSLTPAAYWYLAIALPLSEILALTWVWRWLTWLAFVWRVSRLDLDLVATHPDRSAGLAFLGGASSSFVYPLLGPGLLLTASWLDRHLRDHVPLERFAPMMIAFAAIVMVFAFAPVAVFSRRLRKFQHDSMARYAVLVQRYIVRFEHRWTGPSAPREEEALAELDAQNMADLGQVFETILGMRFIPFEPMVLKDMAFAILLPLIPAVVGSTSPTQILKRIVDALL